MSAKPKVTMYNGYKIITYKDKDGIYDSYIFRDGAIKAIAKCRDRLRKFSIYKAEVHIDEGEMSSYGIII